MEEGERKNRYRGRDKEQVRRVTKVAKLKFSYALGLTLMLA
jgi:hypothetical protein